MATDPQAEALATDDVLIFVSPSGDDKNPGDEKKPIRTFEEAVRRLRPHWRKQQRIKLAPGTYTIEQEHLKIFLGHSIGAEGEPLVIEGAFADQIGRQRVTAQSATSVTFEGSALEPDSLVGSRLRFRNGKLVDQAYVVAGNTADTLTVNGALADAPAVGDSFVIERPAVSIEYPTGMLFSGSGAATLILVGIRFHPTNSGPASYCQFSGGLQVFAEGCEWDMNDGFLQVTEQSFFTAGGVGGVASLPSFSSGCYAHDGFPAGTAVDEAAGFRASNGGVVLGSWVTRKIGLNAQIGAGFSISLSAKDCRLTVDGFYGDSFLELIGPGRIELKDPKIVGDAVKVSHGGHLRMLDMEILNAKGTGRSGDTRGSAVVVDEDSLALLSGVTGTGNTQYGVWADHGARVRADAKTKVTGTKGDIRVGGAVGGVTHSWSQSQAQAGISDPATFTRIEKL